MRKNEYGGLRVEYTSFERVKEALEHKEPDRVPLDIGGTMVTGINVKAMEKLREHLGLAGDVRVQDTVTQMAGTEESSRASSRREVTIGIVRVGAARVLSLISPKYLATIRKKLQ